MTIRRMAEKRKKEYGGIERAEGTEKQAEKSGAKEEETTKKK